MKQSIPIVLGIARGTASAQPASGGQKTAQPGKLGGVPDFRQHVHERDDFTCRCCGFRSLKYQEVLFLNGVTGDARPENMATACIFCQQCFNLEAVSAMRSGVLIWLPEIDQADLHHIARAIYVARISQGPVADAARRSLDVLMQRREEARRRLSTDDPFILSSVLRDYVTDKTYEMRTRKLEGIRIFPLDRRIIKEADLEFNQFPQILAYWRAKDGPFGSTMPRQWIDIYRDINPARAA